MAKIIINDITHEFDPSKQSTIMTIDNRKTNMIPGLCHYNGKNGGGDCGICVVKDINTGEYIKSCETIAKDGMNILSDDETINNMRKTAMEAVILNHQYKCAPCEKLGKCEILSLAGKYGAKKDFAAEQQEKRIIQNFTERRMEIDPAKCILCGRCALACTRNTGTSSLYKTGKDDNGNIGLIYNESKCIYCGQCIKACPVNAIIERHVGNEVKELLISGEKHMVVAMAPSVRVSLGDEFGFGYGANIEKYIFAAFKKIGFDKVFDLNFAADVTIMEEGTELIDRVLNDGALPMFTSCCPGWVEIVVKHAPHLKKNISSCKSPQQIYGALTKSYYAEESGIDPKEIVTVSIIPCTAKKVEADKPYQHVNGIRDIDYVLTTRELAKLLKDMKCPIEYSGEKAEADSFMATYSGAGGIFGHTGGVMTAALRMSYEAIEKKKLENIEFEQLATMDGVKTTTVTMGGKDHKIAVINGTNNFAKFIRTENADSYSFIEVMACNGGCIAGGGQPFLESTTSDLVQDISIARIESLRMDDKNNPVRHCQNNPMIEELYKNYLKSPGGKKSHDILHVDNHEGN